MSWLRNVPIKRKLTLVIVGTCFAALVLACGALGSYHIRDFRQTKERDTAVLLDVVGRSTQAALVFQDENDARKKLQALAGGPGVTLACIYSADGKPFAQYTRSGIKVEIPGNPPSDGIRYASDELEVVRPVILNDKRIGTILMRSDLRGLYYRIRVVGEIVSSVLLGCVLVTFALSSWLQRPISEPILALTQNIRNIADSRDYNLRLPAQGRDETGSLTDAFNHLLAGIWERDAALRSANALLLQEVGERKSAEDRAQAQMGRLLLLQRITHAVGERLDLPSIFQVVVGTLEDQLPLDFCCFCLHEPAAGTIRMSNVGARSEAFVGRLALEHDRAVAAGENGLARCVGGRLVYEPDVSASQFQFPRRLAEAGLHAFVAAPLLVESKVFGVLIAARCVAESFSSGECEFLGQLSEHVALAAHQAQLYTSLQQAYDDLRQTQQAVLQQERLRALGQMASGIAHDINNAISPVGLYAESLLETEPGLSPRARNQLETIQHSIEDVAETVARMKEFYRQREPQLNLLSVQLNPLIQQVVDLSRARWSDMPQQRGVCIELATQLADDLPVIQGVESEIREALLNLVFNAVDAMPDGGKLTLRTRSLRKQDKAQNTSVPCVALEVADSGVGMDEDTRRRCLEPFFTTKGERGTGLGLAMVYGIAQRHGVDIEIQSAVGKGTTFRLVFPAPPDPVRPPRTGSACVETPVELAHSRDRRRSVAPQVTPRHSGNRRPRCCRCQRRPGRHRRSQSRARPQ